MPDEEKMPDGTWARQTNGLKKRKHGGSEKGNAFFESHGRLSGGEFRHAVVCAPRVSGCDSCHAAGIVATPKAPIS